MITTEFVHGSPCWLELDTPDVVAAASFYGAVFDWTLRAFGPDPGGYGFFQLGGKTVGAVSPLSPGATRSAWMLYFQTSDADATAEAVERSGGEVRLAPIEASAEGRMAQFTDPLGGQFAVWQPAGSQGLEAVDGPGTLGWTELYTTDAAAAKKFYGDLFGWQTEDTPLPGGGGTYSIITPAGAGEERMQGGIMQLAAEDLKLADGRPYWHPVFGVTDCDATVVTVTEQGGTVQMGPEDAEGVGRLAVCVDPYGADFVVLTPAGG